MSEVPGLVSASASTAAVVVADKDTITSPTRETTHDEDDEAVHVALRGTLAGKDVWDAMKYPSKDKGYAGKRPAKNYATKTKVTPEKKATPETNA